MGKNKKYPLLNYKNAYIYVIISILFIIFLKPADSMAKVTGKCDKCHTMHNSQNGEVDPNGSPIPSLLEEDCLGCHSHDINAEGNPYYDLDITDPSSSLVPVVNHTGSAPPDTSLAGGNFWWVKEGNVGADDTKGHNVFPGEADENLSAGAPGGVNSCAGNSCHLNFHEKYSGDEEEVGLNGRQGCTGCHMVDEDLQPSGFHHADDVEENEVIDDFPWYRFLKGHQLYGNDDGVSGIEDPDWEATKSAGDHNEYLGELGGYTRDNWDLSVSHTMSAFCCGCHGRFHQQKRTEIIEPWIRHPSDSELRASSDDLGEYQNYIIYDPNVPVARPNLSIYSGPSNKVNPGVDLVMCLSCHRPHGSPYSDILRWNYDDMRVGSNKTGGCFKCHSQKN